MPAYFAGIRQYSCSSLDKNFLYSFTHQRKIEPRACNTLRNVRHSGHSNILSKSRVDADLESAHMIPSGHRHAQIVSKNNIRWICCGNTWWVKWKYPGWLKRSEIWWLRPENLDKFWRYPRLSSASLPSLRRCVVEIVFEKWLTVITPMISSKHYIPERKSEKRVAVPVGWKRDALKSTSGCLVEAAMMMNCRSWKPQSWKNLRELMLSSK